ncbi:MAG: non-structural maintenance of chromosomes element 4 [archaeon GB-1867-005]|nr:non-structural maintenance of chromosomes element 4 [Candidatus Culexmicrobium cathedralense]
MSKRRNISTVKRIVKSCDYVIKRGSDPFQVNVPELLSKLRNYLKDSLSIEDLALDLDAIDRISKIVELQRDWVKSRSSRLYFDPMIIEWKIKTLSLKKLASIIVSAWHPIASIRTISPKAIEAAINYWLNLPPLKDRWGRLPPPIIGVELTSIEDLIKEKLALQGSFNDMIEEFWRRLLSYSNGKPISYWKFVLNIDYEISLLKAYMISFLATYGYIALEFDPKRRDYLIIPKGSSSQVSKNKSIAISITYDEWRRRINLNEQKEN